MGIRNRVSCLALLMVACTAAADDQQYASPTALAELRQAAKTGDTEATFRLAQIYESGRDGIARNYAESASWYLAAAQAGHTESQRRLALMHLEGRGVPQSFEGAQKWFFQASQKNDEISQYQLGLLLLTGRAGKMSVETGIEWLEKSAQAGHQSAQVELGRLYLDGTHVDRDVERGLSWVREAADQEHPPSMFLLATLYESGKLVPENPTMAKTYYTRAADAGFAGAQVWLAKWYERQDPPQYAKALRYYKDAADQSNADGHFGVARLNIERLLYTPNSQEGLRHLRAAVALNHPEAHYTIGLMYGNGSLSGGSAKSLEHFQHAANLNYTPAMYQLAVAYYQGTPPLKRNTVLAAQWWQRAAYFGHLDSQYAYALAHLNGTGVAQNQGIAFALANVAAAQGHPDAERLRDQLLEAMSPELLHDAQDLSVQLFDQFEVDGAESIRSNLK